MKEAKKAVLVYVPLSNYQVLVDISNQHGLSMQKIINEGVAMLINSYENDYINMDVIKDRYAKDRAWDRVRKKELAGVAMEGEIYPHNYLITETLILDYAVSVGKTV